MLRVRFDAATRHGERRAGAHRQRSARRRQPLDAHHPHRPGRQLYVSVGSSCNVCIESDTRRAAILRYDLDGSGERDLRHRPAQRRRLRLAAGHRRRSTPPTTAATCSATTSRPASSTASSRAASTAGRSPTATACPIPTSAPATTARIAASIPPAHGFGAHTAPLGMTFYVPPAGAAPAAFPAALRRRRLRRAARLVEPLDEERLQGRRAALRRRRHDPRGALRHRLRGRREGVRPAGRRRRRPRRRALRLRRLHRLGSTASPTARRRAARRRAAPRRRSAAIRSPASTAPRSSAASARGAALWKANGCAACHVAGQAAGDAYRPLARLRRALHRSIRSPPSCARRSRRCRCSRSRTTSGASWRSGCSPRFRELQWLSRTKATAGTAATGSLPCLKSSWSFHATVHWAW